MNTKNKILLILLLAMLIIVALYLLFTYIGKQNEPYVVSEVPQGYVSLNDLIESTGNKIGYIFWESQIAITNERECIYQTNVKDKDFIVKYQEQYYINVDKFNDDISNIPAN